jgi:adenosylcobinamide kinase/adenosylcobinamide-phosphate guanylyltransferase
MKIKIRKKFIFILGGIRSGKSSYAVELAKKLSKKVLFIATATVSDEEMKKRIELHKAKRPKYWKTIEAKNTISILNALNNKDNKNKYKVVIIDCLNFLVSNLILANLKDEQIIKILEDFINKISYNNELTTILVSNEVGNSLVSDNPLARRFQDLLGYINQLVAKKADEVIFIHAGIPLKIK